MKQAKELYELLKKMSTPGANVFPAIVKSVNSDDTIDADVDGVTYHDVLIKASVIGGQKGIKIKPAVDSIVMIERIGDKRSDEHMVVLFSEIDEQTVEIDNTNLTIDSNGFLIKKGDDTLKDVIQLVIEAVQQIVVIMGNNPDYAKLAQALVKLNNVLQ